MKRCSWTGDDSLLVEYHDKEWGIPLYDDYKQFEYLSMEVMQCGLSWLTVLRKRAVLRSAFDEFDASKVALYDEMQVERIMKLEGMIHSPRKIRAIINNAKAFLKIQEVFGSFSSYLWQFTDNKTVEYPGHADGSVCITRNDLSDKVSRDLKERKFSYLGSITVYSHLQAAGVINDHRNYCFRYRHVEQNL
ncbi:DNA-3-methyladenine glycosylase I [Parasphaerochaeta coccoides]|uniref:DNA-3-methyladenine glycosylase I n=1 Tax=Parasphaerochaeta coccoides (strain ATCC BAA-1237 / DSM 17374 / SPN1) TaxID=760011 RepID=F4GIT2_PARC1|nr:DNA-3-methyladenine glycosylase I [Parasphaerochaeta coccoides]AEC02700.1 DNA-3-methyladenine glycosylase I [Parasphaerochaeta coccoides DSM 17374]